MSFRLPLHGREFKGATEFVVSTQIELHGAYLFASTRDLTKLDLTLTYGVTFCLTFDKQKVITRTKKFKEEMEASNTTLSGFLQFTLTILPK